MDVATEKVLKPDECHVCGDRLASTRRSWRWSIDVGRCAGCGTVSALDAARVVETDLTAVEDTGEETDWNVYSEAMHTAERVREGVLAEIRRRLRARAGEHLLFDVGAGTGAFLDMARSRGFQIAGNDISPSAIRHAAERFSIDLSPAGLSEQPAESVDAITMWCVIAHVGNPRAFLDDAWRMLRPGGVLFLRTPRWCAMDAVGAAAARTSGGRLAQLADQRVTRGHLHLYQDQGMERMLTSLGFTDVEVRPVAHTGCTGAEIASRLGGPTPLQRVASRAIDRAMELGTAPRNTMFVYARRPHAGGTS